MFDPENDKEINVDLGFWQKQRKAFKATRIINLILVLICGGFIAENIYSSNIYDKAVANHTAWNALEVERVKLQDKDQDKKIQDLIAELHRNNQKLQEANDEIKTLKTPKPEEINEPNTYQKDAAAWDHLWKLKEEEARYASIKVLEEFALSNSKYELDHCSCYPVADFNTYPITLRKEAMDLFNKEYKHE